MDANAAIQKTIVDLVIGFLMLAVVFRLFALTIEISNGLGQTQWSDLADDFALQRPVKNVRSSERLLRNLFLVLCRFSDAGMAVSTRARKPASEKRQGTKSRDVWQMRAFYGEPRACRGQKRPWEIDTIVTCWHGS